MNKVLIVDDEPLARSRLRRLLQGINNTQIVGEAADGLQAIEQVKELDPDIVLMDIQMPRCNGLEAAQTIVDTYNPAPAIVFCTAFDQFALDAFKANAAGYLVKPVAAQDLEAAIAQLGNISKPQIVNLREKLDRSGVTFKQVPSVVSRIKSGLLKTPINDIVYFKSADKLVYATTKDGQEIIVDVVLKELVAKFPDELVRVHRNSVVNIAQIASLFKTEAGQDRVSLKDSDTTLEVSRRQLSNVKKTFTTQ